jgi:glycosyltransferase involved in cell wall biosynthesis
MGKGIVASDLEQIGEVLAHGRTAWMVRPGDPEDLARELGELLSSDDWRHELGAAARATVAGDFTWEACGRATVEAYEEALRG